MVTPDGRWVLSYSGEVFNFQELRVALEAEGCQFRSRTDSEVVLYALARWGMGAVDRFNGMFAFALWDTHRKELLLARDRYGVKPLYFTQLGSTLVFASEIKAILEHPKARVDLDAAALVEYFTFQNLFTDKTLFKGIRLLPAGHCLRMSLSNPSLRLTRYWDFSFEEPDGAPDERELTEELARLFHQAVNRQLVADVPLGSYLSGGVDSASITAIAASQIPNLRSFTVGFDLSSASGIELSFDERQRAEQISYLCKTEHYEMVLKAGDMERAMRRLVWHLEDLRVGQSYPNFYAAQLASKFGKVVLSGAGGDEMFGGYPWRYYRAVVNDGFDDYIDKYYGFWQRMLPEAAAGAVFAPLRSEVSGVSTRDIMRDVFAGEVGSLNRPEDYINHSLYFEAKTFLHGLLLVEDKLSMAHGLETRVPFLDNDLVDFAQRVPAGLKLGNLGDVVRLNENEPGPKTQRFFEKTHDGKLILRRMLRRHVPDSVSMATKQGFTAPDASWFRGDSIDFVRRRLVDEPSPLYDYLDRTAVLSLVDDHLDGRENRRLLIWSLLCMDEWCRVFLGGERPES
jgi:asparagine synthase (glutamine-hydrolysing)